MFRDQPVFHRLLYFPGIVLKFRLNLAALISGLFLSFILLTLTLAFRASPILLDVEFTAVSLTAGFVIAGFVFIKRRFFMSYQVGHWMACLIIALLTAIPRLVWIRMVHVVPNSDFATYHYLAKSLVKGTLAGAEYIAIFPHVIGYPVILSLFYRLWGAEVMIAQLVNIVFGTGIAVVVFYVGKRITNANGGLAGAVLYALWPSQVFYASLVATETVFAFLVMLSILFFIKIVEAKRISDRRWLPFLALGLWLAMTNAVRPTAPILLIAIAFYYLVFPREGEQAHRRVRMALIACLSGVFLLSNRGISFMISRAIQKDVATHPAGFSLYVGANYASQGQWSPEDAETLKQLEGIPGIAAQEIHSRLFSAAIGRFKANSFKNLRLFAVKHITLWGADSDGLDYVLSGQEASCPLRLDIRKYQSLLKSLSNLYYYFMLLMVGMSSLFAFQHKECNYLILLFTVVLGLVGLHTLIEVQSRYHFVVIPIFSVIAGYGLCEINRKLEGLRV
jgi:hypothetical protein